MLQFEELRLELNDNKQKLSELREALGLDALKEEIAKLEEQTAAEEFWGDIENSQKVLQRISQLKNKVAAYTSLETAFDDTMTLIELADEEEDLSMFDECREGVTKFEDELENWAAPAALRFSICVLKMYSLGESQQTTAPITLCTAPSRTLRSRAISAIAGI